MRVFTTVGGWLVGSGSSWQRLKAACASPLVARLRDIRQLVQRGQLSGAVRQSRVSRGRKTSRLSQNIVKLVVGCPQKSFHPSNGFQFQTMTILLCHLNSIQHARSKAGNGLVKNTVILDFWNCLDIMYCSHKQPRNIPEYLTVLISVYYSL